MFRVFNMGIGMTVFVSPRNARDVLAALPDGRVIGKVVKQAGEARVIIS